MKLYIKFGSLNRFQSLFDGNKFIRSILGQTRSNVYFIESDCVSDVDKIKELLNENNIKYSMSEE